MEYLYPLLVALIRGLNYVLLEIIYKHKNYLVALFVMGIAQTLFFGLLFFLDKGNIVHDLALLLNPQVLYFFLGGLITFVLSNILLNLAISKSNSTLVSLIEVSYPIFIIATTYLLFGEQHLSLSVLIGGILVMIGVGLVIRGEHMKTPKSSKANI